MLFFSPLINLLFMPSIAPGHSNQRNPLAMMKQIHVQNEFQWGKPTQQHELNHYIIQQARSQMLEASYAHCEEIIKRSSKTFYAVSQLLPPEQMKAIWAIYAWCRRSDDIVDGPRAAEGAPEDVMDDLDELVSRLKRLFNEEKAYDSLDLALLDTKRKYPSMCIKPFLDMVDGYKMDTELGPKRYASWEETKDYCVKVAATVGLMSLPVLGIAPGYTEEQAKIPATDLGIAKQLTNILRDVGEDAARDRIYLPREDMERFGVSDEQILSRRLDSNYVELIKFEIERARDYYRKGEEGVKMLDGPLSKIAVQAAANYYGRILDKIAANDYDNLNRRAFVPKDEKFLELLKSVWTVLWSYVFLSEASW
jgi:phytoene synthase